MGHLPQPITLKVRYSHAYGKWVETSDFEKIGNSVFFQSPDGEILEYVVKKNEGFGGLQKWVENRLNNAMNTKVKIKINF